MCVCCDLVEINSGKWSERRRMGPKKVCFSYSVTLEISINFTTVPYMLWIQRKLQKAQALDSRSRDDRLKILKE